MNNRSKIELTGVPIAPNHMNPHQQASQNHRIAMNRRKPYFYEETPTHICATYAITTDFDQNFF